MKKTSGWLTLLGLAALAFSGLAAADCTKNDPEACNTHLQAAAPTGLGQAWPNTADVSRSPNYHAYVFNLGGIKFVQVNDTNGNVLGAVGEAGDQFIILPVGRFAQLVSTPQQAPALTPAASPSGQSVAVYRDGATTVLATPLSDGTLQLTAAACNGDPAQCSTHKQVTAASCNGDPAQCSTHPQAQTMISAAACDPAQCSTHPQATPLLVVATPIAPADACTRTHDPAICNSH